MKYYITACFDSSLTDSEANKLNLYEFIINRKDEEADLPEFVYTGKIDSNKSVEVLTDEIKGKIIDVVRTYFCFLSVSSDRNWRAFKC